MSDEQLTIKVEGDDTAGHAAAAAWAPEDEAWIKGLADSEKSVRIRIPAGDDTEGHVASATVDVLVSDDDDTEGHAISLHFPSVREANDFRRRVAAAGLITATIAIGAVGGAALGSAMAGDAGSDASAVSGQYSVENMGGTQWAGAQATNLGQFDADNMGGTIAPAAAAETRTGPLGDGMSVGTPTQAGTTSDAFAGHTQYDAGTGAAPQTDDEPEPPFAPNRTTPR
jgi:hypothetical protein